MWLKMNFNTHNLERTVLIQSFIIFITLEVIRVYGSFRNPCLAGRDVDYLSHDTADGRPGSRVQHPENSGYCRWQKELISRTLQADTLAAAVAPVLLLAAGIEHDPKKKKKRRSSLLHQIIRKCFYALPKGAQNKVFPTYVFHNCCDFVL